MTCESLKTWLKGHCSFRSNEQDALSVEAAAHLASCSSCQSLLNQETQFDESVRSVMQQVLVPSDLTSRIHWQLRVARRQRQRARALYWSMAAAAALLLALMTGWYLQRPYDLVRLYETIDGIELRHTGADFAPGDRQQAADLKQWLRRQGVAATIPTRLKLQHLTGAYLVESAGRKVAVLEMRVGSSTSKICLLQRRYFNDKQQKRLLDQENLSAFVIADHDDSDSLGWMIVDQGSAHLFVDDMLPVNGA